jgi:hypothetical protein
VLWSELQRSQVQSTQLLFFSYLFIWLIYSFIHMCIHCLGHISPLLPAPHPVTITPISLASSQNLFSPLLQICWREDISNNKKDIVFLLVRDKDSYTEGFLALLPCTCVLQPKMIHLYQTSSHSDLCQFKVTILALLQWAHQTLSSFGFPTFPYFFCMCSPLSMWPMSNNIYCISFRSKVHIWGRTYDFWPSEPG